MNTTHMLSNCRMCSFRDSYAFHNMDADVNNNELDFALLATLISSYSNDLLYYTFQEKDCFLTHPLWNHLQRDCAWTYLQCASISAFTSAKVRRRFCTASVDGACDDIGYLFWAQSKFARTSEFQRTPLSKTWATTLERHIRIHPMMFRGRPRFVLLTPPPHPTQLNCNLIKKNWPLRN